MSLCKFVFDCLCSRKDRASERHRPYPRKKKTVRMLLVLSLIYDLAVAALDVKDEFLMVPQMEIVYVKILQLIRRWTGSPNTLASQTLPFRARKRSVTLASARSTTLSTS